jgi:type II secretory pathway component GspD/PulD (secretin)
MRHALLGLTLLVSTAVLLRGQDKVEVRAYPVGNLDLETAAGLVRPLLSPAGTVVEDRRNHRLVVADVPAVHARVAQALQNVDVPARNLRITVTHEAERVERRDAVAIHTGPVVSAQSSRSRSSEHARQELVVLSGGRATIEVARQLPYVDWFWTWGQPQGLWGRAVAWRDVGSLLVVEPLVTGEHTVRLRVTPAFSYFVDRDRVVTAVQQLSTEVVVREGEPIDLGGLPVRDRDFYERFLIGFDRQGQTERARITLLARIE